MNLKNNTKKAIRLFAAASALGLTCMANAITYSVSVDTSSLVGDPLGAGPYYLDFQLNDGGVAGNNWAIISDFMFGDGGSATGDIGLFGDASGDLWTSVQLTDTDFWNEFYQSFIPGSWLSFVVELSNNANGPGDFPDLFGFAILDSALGFPANIPTESVAYSLLEVNIDGSSLKFDAFAGIDDYSGISAPVVSQVPDSSMRGACFMALFALFLANRRIRGRRDAQVS